jgi:hypothetical protein
MTNEQMTTGTTQGVGSWEGRMAFDGWALFIYLDGENSVIEIYGMAWEDLRNKLVEFNLTKA